MNLLAMALRIARIRSKTFSLAEFKKLKTAEEAGLYASEHLKYLGSGSSRAVFSLSSSKVLKVAKSLRDRGSVDAGISQNKSEVNLVTDPRIKPIVAKVFDYGPDFIWVMSEAVRQLESYREFEDEVGFDLIHLVELATRVVEGEPYENIMKQISEMIRETNNDRKIMMNTPGVEDDDEYELEKNEFSEDIFKGIIELIKFGLVDQDLMEFHQWGKTSDGRIVVLDYGFDRETQKEFY